MLIKGIGGHKPSLKDNQCLEQGRKETAVKDPERDFLLWSEKVKGK